MSISSSKLILAMAVAAGVLVAGTAAATSSSAKTDCSAVERLRQTAYSDDASVVIPRACVGDTIALKNDRIAVPHQAGTVGAASDGVDADHTGGVVVSFDGQERLQVDTGRCTAWGAAGSIAVCRVDNPVRHN